MKRKEKEMIWERIIERLIEKENNWKIDREKENDWKRDIENYRKGDREKQNYWENKRERKWLKER